MLYNYLQIIPKIFKISVRIIAIPAPGIPQLNLIIKSQLVSQCIPKVTKWINVNGYAILCAIINTLVLSNSNAKSIAGNK